MSGAAAVRNYISNLSGSLVTRRELIARFESDDAVDKELGRLIARRLVERVAAGVYSVLANRRNRESALAIAEARCRAFGKRLVFLNDEQTGERQSMRTSYFSDGCSTSFNSVHGRICLKPVAPRKISAVRNRAGLAAQISKEPPTKAYPSPAPAMSNKTDCSFNRRLRFLFERIERRLERLRQAIGYSRRSAKLSSPVLPFARGVPSGRSASYRREKEHSHRTAPPPKSGAQHRRHRLDAYPGWECP